METELQLLFRSIHHALRRHENSQKNTAFRFLSHSKERSRHSNAKAVFLTHEINRIILKRMKKESLQKLLVGRASTALSKLRANERLKGKLLILAMRNIPFLQLQLSWFFLF